MIGQYLSNTNERAFYKIGLGLFLRKRRPHRGIFSVPLLCVRTALRRKTRTRKEKPASRPAQAVARCCGQIRRRSWAAG